MRDDHVTDQADDVFNGGLAWLGATYGSRVFYTERDIVYTLQARLNDLISEARLPLRLYNDFPMLPGPRRSLSTDLALVDLDGAVAVAVEFKYEPCHCRLDVLKNKLPVTSWPDIMKDISRIHQFVDQGKAELGYAICIDESGYLARRDLSAYSHAQLWRATPRHDHEVTALVHRYPASN